ncbi:hypothetical protein ACSMXN_00120 [Jatrophihabitans sp. DSM 45814]
MSNTGLTERSQDAVQRSGYNETVIAAGIFFPRGHTAGAFAGGLVGGSIGDAVGGIAGGVGAMGGALAGRRVADATSGLPQRTVIAVTEKSVFGFDSARVGNVRQPTTMLFHIDRHDLVTRIHQRVNVRVLELHDQALNTTIEIEGSRIPVLHAGEVISALKA